MIEIFKEFLELERPLNEGILKKLESNLKTNFIYNSNAIEGNTLTLKETDIILRYGVTVKGKSLKEHEEVKGQEYALNFLKEVIKTNESLSLRVIRKFHALVLNDDIENRGKFKKSNNEILGAGFETTPYYLVEEKLTELIEKFNSSENNDLIMKVACFHADFEKIHPFIDGNGRTGRLLLNLELMKNGYPITVIRNEDRDEYYTALETAQVESNYELLAGFIEKSAENTFWMYYKYFDENTKIKFEEYLKNKIILEYILYKALHLDFEKFSTTRATDEMLEEYKEDNDYLYSFTKDWYVLRNLPKVERVPLPLVKMEFKNYIESNYYDYKITSSFGKELVIHLNNIYKEVGYKYKVDRAKIRIEDRRGITHYLMGVEYTGKIPDNLVHCIVKIQ